MSGVQTIAVADDDGEIRLDRWFRRHFPGLGHGRLEKLLRTGQIRVDGRRAQASDRITPGQLVRVPPLGDLDRAPPPAGAAPRPSDIAMVQKAVLHIDDDVLVIDKPPGLAVQGGTNTDIHLDALLDGLRFGAPDRPRLVHRLDRDTSGVLVLARNAKAAAALSSAFRNKATRKFYWAAVAGLLKPRQGRINQALAKLPGPAGERMSPDEEGGKHAVTHYRTVSHAGDKVSWLTLQPMTGRTHQLRVHCKVLGTPIIGDRKYGGAVAHPSGVPNSNRLHLHARALSIPHPRQGVLRIT